MLFNGVSIVSPVIEAAESYNPTDIAFKPTGISYVQAITCIGYWISPEMYLPLEDVDAVSGAQSHEEERWR